MADDTVDLTPLSQVDRLRRLSEYSYRLGVMPIPSSRMGVGLHEVLAKALVHIEAIEDKLEYLYTRETDSIKACDEDNWNVPGDRWRVKDWFGE